MNTGAILDKQDLIQYISENNSRIKSQDLQDLSLEALVLIKVHIEIEIENKKK